MMTAQNDAFDRLSGMLLGHQATEIAAIGIRSGLFAAIAARPGVTDEELAAESDFAPRYVSAWTRGAFAHAFLDRSPDGGYELPAALHRILLDQTAPSYLGGRFRMASACDDDYHRYPELMRSGSIWPRGEHKPEMLAALADSSTPDATMVVMYVLPHLPDIRQRLERGGSILDVGAGGGVHAVHYARAFPASHVVAIEPDGPSVEMARAHVADAGLGDRVELRQQGVNELADSRRYDLATMNLVLHETGGPEDHLAVLRRTLEALRPDGAIVVSELPYPDDIDSYRSDPVHRRLAGLQLHETVVGCGAITQRELLGLLDAAGFADVTSIDQPRATRFVVTGRRP